MDHDHWLKVQGLFELALERPPEDISGWLEEACDGDATLKGEVEDLLRADEAAGSFIQTKIDGVRSPRTDAAPAPVLKFGKYEIEGKIGQGGFGVVYRGRDPVLGRYIALKTCSTADAKLRRRFFREGRIAAGLQHPNVTTIHDLGVEEGVPYLVQEFLGGEDLDHVIERRESMSLATKLDYLVQIGRGLEYAHGAGVLHRDIKPGNVRVQDSGAIKIMDFGIAKLLNDDTGLTGTGMALGTVGYLAPEQLRAEPVDPRADIFSFGVLAYEFLAYERPFKGENFSQISYQLLYVEPTPLSEAWPQCPHELASVVDRCLEKDSALRFATFTEVLAELEPQLDMLRTSASSGVRAPTVVLPSSKLPKPASSVSEVAATIALPAQGRFQPLLAVSAMVGILAAAVLWVWRSAEEPATPGPETALATETAAAPDDLEGLPSAPVPAGDAGLGENTGESPLVTASSTETSPAPEDLGDVGRRPEPPPPAVVEVAPPPPAVERPGTVSVAGGVEPEGIDLDPAPESVPDHQPEKVTNVAVAPSESLPLNLGSDSGADKIDVEPARASAEERPKPVSNMRRGDLITAGPGVETPHLLSRPQPRYPERARRRGREGRMVVRVLVDENGRVLQAIAPAKDRFGFGESARQAALQASFEPATKDGIAGKMWTEMLFQFKLKQ